MITLTEEQLLMLDTVKAFCAEEVAPHILPDLEHDVFPPELLERMRELGIAGLTIPEAFGGLGESMLTQTLIEEELAKTSMTVAMAAAATTLVAKSLITVGTDEQKERLLPQLIGRPVAFALTEPGAGSDVAAMQTTAVKNGDEWVINGQKTFISFVGQSDYVAVGARTNETGDGGISMFLVPIDTPGFTVGGTFEKLGWHASGTTELFFEDVHVPAGNLLGRENKGMHVALGLLDEARVGVAACAVGICEACIEKASAYVKERIAFGKPLATKQGLQWYLAEMDAKTAAARALLYQTACAFDAGERATVDAARAKLVATDAAAFVTRKAVQICGGLGLMREYGIERMFRDVKVLEIIEGTDEILKMVISRDVLN